MSTIKSSAENLTLNADGANNDIKFQSNGSEVASIDQAGLVTATSFAGSGANLTGISSVGGATGVDFNDSVKARFGTGNDLEIYHDAIDSYVKDNGTGNLLLQGTNLNLQSTAAENYIRCTADAQVELYHNNVKKIETTSAGVDITGRLGVGAAADANVSIKVTSDGSSAVQPGIKFVDSNSGDDYQIYVNSGSLHFRNTTDGQNIIGLDGDGMFNIRTFSATGGSSGAQFNTDGKLIISGAGSGSRNMIGFYNSNVNVGNIITSGSSTSYSTSSDYRLKENVDYTWDATTRLKQLKPARFNFIADADTTVDGFIAHEVSSVVPEAITGAKDAVDSDNNPEHQSIDQSKLVPLLVKTIQELEARITALEA